MRYCPDNIGRDTISRDANLYDAYIAKLLLRVTPLHYLLGQGTYHASCNSCAPPHSGNCFWNYMPPAYIEYDNLLVFSELYHL